MRREKTNYIIQSVAHALDVLEDFKGDAVELGVTELSKKLKLHKNNIFRLLATLEARGYIEQNKSTENYRLGLKFFSYQVLQDKLMGLVRNLLEDRQDGWRPGPGDPEAPAAPRPVPSCANLTAPSGTQNPRSSAWLWISATGAPAGAVTVRESQ